MVFAVQLNLMEFLFILHIVDIDLIVAVHEDQTAAEDIVMYDSPFGRFKSEKRELVIPLLGFKDPDRIPLKHEKLGNTVKSLSGMVEEGRVHLPVYVRHSAVALGKTVKIVLRPAGSVHTGIRLEGSLPVR